MPSVRIPTPLRKLTNEIEVVQAAGSNIGEVLEHLDKAFPGLKERIASLKAIREQASADAERAQAALDHAGNQAVSPDMVRTFARAARQRIRLDGGGYRRDHLRALAQRVEVADKEVRIMGSKSELLRTLVAASGGKPGVAGVQSSVLKWRARHDSNVWPPPSEGGALSS